MYIKALARARKADPDGTKHRVNAKALREERKAKGLCIDCGKPADGIHIRCPSCQRKHRESNQVYEIRKRVKREAEEERKACNSQPLQLYRSSTGKVFR